MNYPTQCPRCNQDTFVDISENITGHTCGCGLGYSTIGMRSPYYYIVIVAVPRTISLRWYEKEGTCYLGEVSEHRYNTAVDVGWQPYDIPIDTVKIWITFS